MGKTFPNSWKACFFFSGICDDFEEEIAQASRLRGRGINWIGG
jgi:hypothetical protein